MCVLNNLQCSSLAKKTPQSLNYISPVLHVSGYFTCEISVPFSSWTLHHPLSTQSPSPPPHAQSTYAGSGCAGQHSDSEDTHNTVSYPTNVCVSSTSLCVCMCLCVGFIDFLLYLPCGSIVSEVMKLAHEPLIDLIKSQLLVWRLQYGLTTLEGIRHLDIYKHS